MKPLIAGFLALFLPLLSHGQPGPVSFSAADGVELFGDIYMSDAGKSAPLILLFHQAGGDARGEYTEIANRLVDTGYNVLAIDQRSGGDRFGGTNRTVEKLSNAEFGYCEVYPDLEATLAFARAKGFDGSLAVWGSSYSAALVFQLGAKNIDEVDAVLAFSPAAGGPLANCKPQEYVADLLMPVLALRPINEYQIETVKAQLDEMRDAGIQTYVADPGVHGSSMLVADRVNGDVEATWNVVLEFLENALDAD